jgi:hypothetical protein
MVAAMDADLDTNYAMKDVSKSSRIPAIAS